MTVRIDFLHPEFHQGVNSTVRLGTRYYASGTKVQLAETGAKYPKVDAEVLKCITLPYNILKDDLIMCQHDIETRTKEGLWEAMIRAYGDKFKGDSVVTIIYFWVE